jgi:hypothetical protein
VERGKVSAVLAIALPKVTEWARRRAGNARRQA